MYGLIEVDDFVLICRIWICRELASHILLVLFKLLHSMGVNEDDCSCVSGVGNHPLSINPDLFGQFATAPSCIKANVDVSNSLCFSVVRFKCVISRENLVEVDISVEEDVIPL